MGNKTSIIFVDTIH